MPEQKPEVRARNFQEVTLGYSKAMAMEEASRCLNCKNKPCVSGCPVGVRIPEFIACVAAGDFDKAYDIITSTNGLPAVCGRVCPQEHQCEGKCVRGIKGESVGIGRLERFVADYHMNKEVKDEIKVPESNGHRIAIIGSGPASLACAGDLRKLGYDVTIFEAFHKSGGVLVYGIPQFRLPKEIVAAEIENLKAMGVKIVNNAIVGKSETVDELFEDGFEAVFIGSGAGLPQFLHIPGENLLGVYSANELLTRVNLMKAYKDDYDTPIKHFHNVAVVGAGNVAMDAARVSKRLGAEHVYVCYRRGKDGTPEIVEAEADIVRTIFRRFLEGATPAMISRELNLAGIPCPSRKSLLSENEAEIAKARKKTSRWGTSTVENILANEKYKGDAILQKTYCTDYLLKTFVVNDGSVVPKYYAQNSHPAIVSPEVFDLVQEEIARRRNGASRYSGVQPFSECVDRIKRSR